MTGDAETMDILEMYRRTGAMRTGHFLLAAGGHTDRFFQSATVMQFPDAAQSLGRAIAEKWHDAEIAFVIGPAMGGVVLAAVTAQFLGVRALFAEKSVDGETMFIRPGMTVRRGERFLAVEDVVTTGGSVMKAIRAAEAEGGVCVGVSSVIDRNEGETPFPYPYRPVTTLRVMTFDPDDCPLCREGVPLEKI